MGLPRDSGVGGGVTGLLYNTPPTPEQTNPLRQHGEGYFSSFMCFALFFTFVQLSITSLYFYCI